MNDNPLRHRIRQQIEITGPMSVADYMNLCLLDPTHGYYTRAQPFGADGDFITAPEISQLFGEIIGAWLINTWQLIGKPSSFILAEAGPGRGTLMRDFVRTAKVAPAFLKAADITLIEASPRLREVQRETLGNTAQRVSWLDRVDDLPAKPLLLVTNEFFDALPLRQFVKTGTAWHERAIGLDTTGTLQWVTTPTRLAVGDVPARLTSMASEGSILEVSPAREAAAATLAQHVRRHGGATLHFDYGHTRTALGDTFQAIQAHAFADPLADPGQADLTSHVDFEAIAKASAAAGAKIFAPVTQSQFLLGCGLLERAGQLGAGLSLNAQDDIRAAVQRLAGTGEGEMGALFNALCFAQPDCPKLPPFHAD